MSSVRCGHGWQEIEIRPWWRGPGARDWLQVDIRGVDEARRLLGTYLPYVQSMRSLLALDAGVDVARLTDHEVLERVAVRLAQRDLLVAIKGGLEPGSGPPPASASSSSSATGATAPAQPTRSASAVTPSALRSGGASPAPAVAPAAPPEDEALDQDAQAATLRQAAADGVPFCEVCEQLKAQRAAEARQAA
jgi:hypothetical protein